MLAWQQAARGLHDDARASLARARELTDRAGTTQRRRPPGAHRRRSAPCAAATRRRRGACWSRGSPSTAGSGRAGSRSASRPCWSRRTSGWAGSTTPRALTARYADVVPPAGPAAVRRAAAAGAGAHRRRRRATPRAAFAAAMQAHAARPTTPSRRRGPGCCTAAGCVVPANGSPPARTWRRPARRSRPWTSPTGRASPQRSWRPPAPRPTRADRRRRAADLAGDPGRPAGRAGPVQPRDRRVAVPQPEDRRAPPGHRVPQARLPLPHRAGSRVRACSVALTLLAPARRTPDFDHHRLPDGSVRSHRRT